MKLKEEPNTPKVNVWPIGYRDSSEIRNSISDDVADKVSKKLLSEVSDENEDSSEFWRKFEKYSYILGGIITWIFSSYKLLQYLKFPFHKHNIEFILILVIPIIIIILFIQILDRQFMYNEKKLN